MWYEVSTPVYLMVTYSKSHWVLISSMCYMTVFIGAAIYGSRPEFEPEWCNQQNPLENINPHAIYSATHEILKIA